MGKTGWLVVAIVMGSALAWAQGTTRAADPLCAALHQALVAVHGAE